ncbi:hypothetical protein M407DRAFT_144664 [Tulasnella calospora MUT 4182]|uniref:Uncharacterized protein n=1 Tax=Tulasnella calospora MUT 4182 TaxID=1051891 RepID=A0A0C3Q754_9AGAM|nr:hypothetical protein M407DRAFT_144664 [Tulasnella calospora MUT 4182]
MVSRASKAGIVATSIWGPARPDIASRNMSRHDILEPTYTDTSVTILELCNAAKSSVALDPSVRPSSSRGRNTPGPSTPTACSSQGRPVGMMICRLHVK